MFLKSKKLVGINKIDIGCGNFKEDGYFGLDAFKGPQVDYVIDLSKEKLPFKDDSIVHAVTFHALEHINNYKNLIDEIWRVLKPNAQFFVSVPYFNNYINIANIYHVNHFNEHSFRFFSSEESKKCLPERIWKFKFAPTWGLKGSANSSSETEFRCLKIEFDYYPEYKSLTDSEKEIARLTKPNVVHNICFYLQTIKKNNDIIDITPDNIVIPKRRIDQLKNNW